MLSQLHIAMHSPPSVAPADRRHDDHQQDDEEKEGAERRASTPESGVLAIAEGHFTLMSTK